MPVKPIQRKIALFLLGFGGLAILAFFVYQFPQVQSRLAWRIDRTMTFLRGVVDPVKPMPTAALSQLTTPGASDDPSSIPSLTMPTVTPTIPLTATPKPTLEQSPTPVPSPTALPAKVELQSPDYELQDINNCGPATLTMALRYYGWEGDQFTISDILKPKREDRNVNVEELVSYVLTQAAWLEPQYRVGGDIQMLRKLVAAGFPVVVEEAFIMEDSYWYNDDRWAGHYLLITGYDDAAQQFITQDVFVGANHKVSYATLDKNWKAFNRVYLLVYPPDQRPLVQEVLGDQWDQTQNRQHALDVANQEVKKDSTDSFALFNLGTNLVYFDRYQEAAKAYDTARSLGLPQRMLRYQFGPFFTYFNIGRNDDLLALTEYALKRTPNSEEAMLWRGWALYHLGKKEELLTLFQEALDAHPGYPDAQYALDFVQSN